MPLVLQYPRPPTEVPNRKGCRVGHGKTAEKQLEKQPKPEKTAVLTAFRLFFGCFGCFSSCFFSCFAVTHSAPFSAVFRLFLMSGIRHLCRWQRRLQPSYPFYPLKRVPSYPFLAENPSSEGATKDHLSSKPPQEEPPGTKNQSGR